MRLYDSMGPNPAAVRIFMAEKALDFAKTTVDLMGGENRLQPFLAKNPTGLLPALELDDGTVIAEITAIGEYLEELYPEPPLIGRNARERAETRMWTRRIDLNILEPMANGFRYGDGLRFFQKRMTCIPQAAVDLKALAQEKLAWLDGQMTGKSFVCGDRITLADILLFAFLDFFDGNGQPVNRDLQSIAAWYDRMRARPSATA